MSKPNSSLLRRTGLNWPVLATIVALFVKSVVLTTVLREPSLVAPDHPVVWLAGHSLLPAASLAAVLLLSPLLLLRGTIQLVALLMSNLAVTLLLLADFVHMRFYGVMLSLRQDLDPQMIPIVVRSAAMLLSPWHALLFVDVIAIGVFFFTDEEGRLRLRPRPSPARFRVRLVATAVLLGSAILLAIPAARAFDDHRLESRYLDLQREMVETVGILPFHIGELLLASRADEGSDSFTIAEIEAHLDELCESATSDGSRPSALHGIARGHNLILISGESWMTFTLGLEVRGQPVTPHLTRFADESLRWERFYDQTHRGTTADADFMANQSLHPTSGTPVATRFHDNRFHGLPAVLSTAGYSTLAACAAPEWFWGMSIMHRSFGYESGYYRDFFREGEVINDWLADEEFFAQMLPVLRQQTEPFHAFFLSSSNHVPFEIPPHQRRLDLGKLEGTRLGNYLHSVHYWDRAFGSFVAGLREAGLLERSVVAVYGDHEGWLRRPPELADLLDFSESSQLDHLIVELSVPFLVRLPGGQAAGLRVNSGGHVDIAPTLLSLLGVSRDGEVFLGRDLTTGVNSTVVFRDGSFVRGNRLLQNRLGPIERARCFDITSRIPIPCQPLEEGWREARLRLRLSDAILRRDLIPELRARALASATEDR